jgi:uncharacterized phage-like protein YoqJ
MAEWILLKNYLPLPNEMVYWYDAMFDNIMYFKLTHPLSYDSDFSHFSRQKPTTRPDEYNKCWGHKEVGWLPKKLNMATKIITITGHRPNKLDNDYDMSGVKSKALFVLLEGIFKTENATDIIVGMALGTDTIAALVALNNNLELTCAIPFIGQEDLWPKKSQDIYHSILKKAHKVEIVSNGPKPTKPWEISKAFNDRNKWMVDQLTPGRDKVVAVWDGSPGGTKNCVDYAVTKQPGIEIIRINPTDMTVSDYKQPE